MMKTYPMLLTHPAPSYVTSEIQHPNWEGNPSLDQATVVLALLCIHFQILQVHRNVDYLWPHPIPICKNTLDVELTT